MGQGEENKTRAEPSVEIQERGEIFLFYRPKVNKEEAHGPEDVQRLYLVLRPESGEKRFEEIQEDRNSPTQATNQAAVNVEEEGVPGGSSIKKKALAKIDIQEQPLLRYIVMGRKSLPQPNNNNNSKSSPYWGFVEMVTTHIQQLKDALKGEEYETATRGHRHLSDSRAVGEGVYRILRHINTGKKNNDDDMHTHLIYKLEFPAEGEEKGGPQEALNIAREASFIIQIKNPRGGGGGGLDKKRKATFPAHMQGLLGSKRFHPADPPDFLNYEGCEFVLISASDDIEQELGLELKAEEDCSDLLQTFGDDVGPTRPLFEGTWV